MNMPGRVLLTTSALLLVACFSDSVSAQNEPEILPVTITNAPLSVTGTVSAASTQGGEWTVAVKNDGAPLQVTIPRPTPFRFNRFAGDGQLVEVTNETNQVLQIDYISAMTQHGSGSFIVYVQQGIQLIPATTVSHTQTGGPGYIGSQMTKIYVYPGEKIRWAPTIWVDVYVTGQYLP